MICCVWLRETETRRAGKRLLKEKCKKYLKFQSSVERRVAFCVLSKVHSFRSISLSSREALVYVYIYRLCEPQRDVRNIKARCDKLRRICAKLMYFFCAGYLVEIVSERLEMCCQICSISLCWTCTELRLSESLLHHISNDIKKCRPKESLDSFAILWHNLIKRLN